MFTELTQTCEFSNTHEFPCDLHDSLVETCEYFWWKVKIRKEGAFWYQYLLDFKAHSPKRSQTTSTCARMHIRLIAQTLIIPMKSEQMWHTEARRNAERRWRETQLLHWNRMVLMVRGHLEKICAFSQFLLMHWNRKLGVKNHMFFLCWWVISMRILLSRQLEHWKT